MRFHTGLPGLMRYPPGFTPEWETRLTAPDFQAIARAADDLGYDSIQIPEHIVMPKELAKTMGAHWPHAFTTMAFVAGATTRIAVNSCVIVLPYHEPIALAKAVATLDVLTGGRVLLTFGVGHAEEEFHALGVPFEKRGRITDEYIEVMKVLWTEDAPSYEGEFVSFKDVQFEPKPVQRPHPTIWIGGNSLAAVRRAARNRGWMPWLVTQEELPARLDDLRAMPGYAADGFDIVMSPAPLRVRESDHSLLDDDPRPGFANGQAVIDAIGHLSDIGVTWTNIPHPGPPTTSLAEHLEHLAWGAETVMPLFRSE
ncbi:MAG: TIGR03619 family F420-dependent LLM class oxidoreductase [Acidimicrobiia bacterium]